MLNTRWRSRQGYAKRFRGWHSLWQKNSPWWLINIFQSHILQRWRVYPKLSTLAWLRRYCWTYSMTCQPIARALLRRIKREIFSMEGTLTTNFRKFCVIFPLYPTSKAKVISASALDKRRKKDSSSICRLILSRLWDPSTTIPPSSHPLRILCAR